MASKLDEMKLGWIHEHVSTAEPAPKTNHIKSNWIHVRVTKTKLAPKFEQMKLKCHFLNTITELPPKPYQTITSPLIETMNKIYIKIVQE